MSITTALSEYECVCVQDKEDQLSCVFSDDYSQGLPSDIEWGNEFEEDLGMYSYF